MSKVAMETKVCGFLLKVPFACHGSEVTVRSKDLRCGDGMVHLCVTCGNAILAGQQRDAGRVAFCGVVELREPEAIGCERIEVGCVNFTSVATNVRVAKIVHHDHNNVWRGGGLRGGRNEEKENRSNYNCDKGLS